MYKKHIALIITLALVNQISGYDQHIYEQVGDNNNSYKQTDSKHAKEEGKVNAQKLDILQKELEEMTDTQKKLILNQKHLLNEKTICFGIILLSAAGAGASLFLGDKDAPNKKILGASIIMGLTSGGLYAGSSYNQNYVLNNLTVSKNQTINAISNVKQH